MQVKQHFVKVNVSTKRTREDERSCKLNDVLTKLENLEKYVRVSEQRAETALSAALSSLETTTQKQGTPTPKRTLA